MDASTLSQDNLGLQGCLPYAIQEADSSCTSGHLLDPEQARYAVEDIFITNHGLNWTTATALTGAHTIGRALPQDSGFYGFLVSGPQSPASLDAVLEYAMRG